MSEANCLRQIAGRQVPPAEFRIDSRPMAPHVRVIDTQLNAGVDGLGILGQGFLSATVTNQDVGQVAIGLREPLNEELA